MNTFDYHNHRMEQHAMTLQERMEDYSEGRRRLPGILDALMLIGTIAVFVALLVQAGWSLT